MKTDETECLEESVRMVCHDLHGPLCVARGRLALAREEYDSEDLLAVERAHERMETLIDDLLTLTRDGEYEGETESIALAETVNECWQTIETKTATLSVETDRTIQADRSQLRRLLENLLRNAVEHSGRDGAVMVGDVADGFFIEDDGPGIPEVDRERVFEQGYSTRPDGTGVGLQVVARVADAHGWSVRVGKGTVGGARFEVTGIDPYS